MRSSRPALIEHLPTLLRAVVGVILVTVLSYEIVASPSPPFPQAAGLVLIGVAGGLVIGTWWSIPIPPLAIFVTAILWRQIECADCPPGESVATPLWFDLVVLIGLLSIPAAAAAVSVFAVKSLSGHRTWTTMVAVLLPLLGPIVAYGLRDSGVLVLGNLVAYSCLFAIFGIGSGLLLGRWWIVVYATVIGIGWPMAFDTSFYQVGVPGLVSASIVYGVLPFAIGTVLGVVARRHPWFADRSHSALQGH